MPGTLQILVFTGGEYADIDGYSLAIDGDSILQIATDGTEIIDSLDNGSHTVAISGLSQNCKMRGPASVDVEISSGETVTARFEVDCDTQPEECEFNLDLAVSDSTPPVFTWNPVCRIVRLSVSDVTSFGIVWTIEGPPFLSPLPYGSTPDGLTVGNGPVPLIPGHQYLALAEFFLASGSRSNRNKLFTR